MSFDPCPASLQADRLASFKCTDRFSSAWLDVTGSFSLTNNNTVQTRKAMQGRSLIGPTGRLAWDHLEAWSTGSASLIRNGLASTKCAVVYHERENYDDVGPSGNTNSTYLLGSGTGTELRGYAERTSTGTQRFRLVVNGNASNLAFGSFAFSEPILMTITTNGVDETTLCAYTISNATLVGSITITDAPATYATEYYGRPNLSAASGSNGSVTLIDMISIFSMELADADFQAICRHIVSQHEFMQAFTAGRYA